MVPPIAVGAALFAVVTYAIKQSEIRKLEQAVLDLEASSAKLQRTLEHSTKRELDQRIERVRLVIGWCRERLNALQATSVTGAPLSATEFLFRPQGLTWVFLLMMAS